MPVNRNALIRYKTLDKCFSNPYRRWSLEDLVEACSDALYEYEGITKGVSKRTVQGDIQMMRSDKLGYNAPIEVYDRSFYRYSDPEYSITNMPLSRQDLDMLNDAVTFLNQFKGFSHFQELNGMVKKIEDKVHSDLKHTQPIIEMESNEQLKGLEYIDFLYQSIADSTVLNVKYQSFKSEVPVDFIFHPYLLKEYNNRWFMVGKRDEQEFITNYALDRIVELSKNESVSYRSDPKFSSKSFYKYTVGVTVNNMRPKNIHLWVDKDNAPYVITKPLHHTQRLIEEREDGIEIQLRIIPNYEFERLILGFAEGIKVISPARIRRRIEEKLIKAIDNYSHNDSNDQN